MSTELRIIIESDGSVQLTQRLAGYGVVVRDAATGKTIVECRDAIGDVGPNVAEYRGLIAGLRVAVLLGATEADVRLDDQVLVEQMSGRSRVRTSLVALHHEAMLLAEQIKFVRFTWVSRRDNKRADRLARQARSELSREAP